MTQAKTHSGPAGCFLPPLQTLYTSSFHNAAFRLTLLLSVTGPLMLTYRTNPDQAVRLQAGSQQGGACRSPDCRRRLFTCPTALATRARDTSLLVQESKLDLPTMCFCCYHCGPSKSDLEPETAISADNRADNLPHATFLNPVWFQASDSHSRNIHFISRGGYIGSLCPKYIPEGWR